MNFDMARSSFKIILILSFLFHVPAVWTMKTHKDGTIRIYMSWKNQVLSQPTTDFVQADFDDLATGDKLLRFVSKVVIQEQNPITYSNPPTNFLNVLMLLNLNEIDHNIDALELTRGKKEEILKVFDAVVDYQIKEMLKHVDPVLEYAKTRRYMWNEPLFIDQDGKFFKSFSPEHFSDGTIFCREYKATRNFNYTATTNMNAADRIEYFFNYNYNEYKVPSIIQVKDLLEHNIDERVIKWYIVISLTRVYPNGIPNKLEITYAKMFPIRDHIDFGNYTYFMQNNVSVIENELDAITKESLDNLEGNFKQISQQFYDVKKKMMNTKLENLLNDLIKHIQSKDWIRSYKELDALNNMTYFYNRMMKKYYNISRSLHEIENIDAAIKAEDTISEIYLHLKNLNEKKTTSMRELGEQISVFLEKNTEFYKKYEDYSNLHFHGLLGIYPETFDMLMSFLQQFRVQNNMNTSNKERNFAELIQLYKKMHVTEYQMTHPNADRIEEQRYRLNLYAPLNYYYGEVVKSAELDGHVEDINIFYQRIVDRQKYLRYYKMLNSW